MGKFRSKLKRNTKGAKWAHGQSATSNPENKKHRMAARSRFFQSNLNADARQSKTNGITTPLTTEALSKHDARQSYAGNVTSKSIASTKTEPTVHDIAMSLHSFSMSDADENQSYARTFQTFGSQYSSCTNMTFNKFLNRFQQTSDLHKEMLAILSAITEVIKERNGTQSSTEFFLGLMETLEVTKEVKEVSATLSLLTMVIKSVPLPVLRQKFSEAGEIFLQLFEEFAQSDNQNVLRSIIGCISVLLRAQEYVSWSAGLTLKLFNHILSFVIHTKPNIRKAAHRAIESIIYGCCFMVSKSVSDDAEMQEIPKAKFHPAGTYVAKFCIEQFKMENVSKSQTVVLYAIELIKKTLSHLKNEDIKEICEYLLSIMVTSRTTIQKNCFDTLDQLFGSKSPNLSQDLLGKLIAAIYDYRPERADVNLTLAWINVLKRGHICLTSFNVTKCLIELPRFITIMANDVWKSENLQIATGAYHTIKELLDECVRSGLHSDASANAHRKPVTKIINELMKCLKEPFGHVAQQIVGVFQTVFEVCGGHFAAELQPALNQITARYDDTATKQIQIENAVKAAISTMGPQAALTAVPLTDSHGNVIITRLWVLQALKRAIQKSSFEFFYRKILPMANQCFDNWKKFQAEDNLASARSNELFYIQLWDLFPSFCNEPKDLDKFRLIAKTLGDAMKNRIEVRMAVFDGLKKLLQNASEDAKSQLAGLSKNFLNILLNIYTQKQNGSEEHTSRISAMEVIQEYLKITPKDVLMEIFNSVKNEYKEKERIEMILHKLQELNNGIDRTDEEEINGNIAVTTVKNMLEGNPMALANIENKSEEISALLKSIPKKRLQGMFKSTHNHFNSFIFQAYFELLVVLAIYQSANELNDLFIDYIEPTLRNAKKGGVTHLIKERQAKSYELLQNILESKNRGCKHFVSENLLAIQKVLLNTLQNRKAGSQDARLTCLLLLIEKEEPKLQWNSKLVARTIPEIVMSFNQPGKKPKDNIALKLLLKIGTIHQDANKLTDLTELIMAGLDAEADDVLISNTIQVLHALLQNFTQHLTLSVLNSILEQVLAQLITGSRQKVKTAIGFLMTFIKLLPASYVANHLPNIVKAMSAMKPDTKRFYRKQLGFTYKRLCKRFTPEEIVKLVPGNDEITHKKLKNIRKALARSLRRKEADKSDSDDDGIGDEEVADSDQDILADSDSDNELQEDILMDRDDAQTERPKKKARRKQEKYIYEDADTIVDLADIKAMSSIATTKPVKGTGHGIGEKKNTKDPNRGFKMDHSGKLIIEEPKRGGNKSDDTDSDEEIDENGNENKEISAEESDSDNEATENARAKNRKRKANSALSQASGKTGKYVAGGKGIHRPLTEAASVRSGYTATSAKTSASKVTSAYGSEYRAKKAKGDMKKKIGVDPYAYIPLSRNTLNKRKRAKNSGQFKSIVQGAKKGAAAGSKRHKV